MASATASPPESRARQMGLFLYVFIAVLILALFAVVAGQGSLTLLNGAPS